MSWTTSSEREEVAELSPELGHIDDRSLSLEVSEGGSCCLSGGSTLYYKGLTLSRWKIDYKDFYYPEKTRREDMQIFPNLLFNQICSFLKPTDIKYSLLACRLNGSIRTFYWKWMFPNGEMKGL